MRTQAGARRRDVGSRVTSAEGASDLGALAVGALAVGAVAGGAVAIGALAIRSLVVKRGRIGRLDIEELEVGRLRVRELINEESRVPRPFEALEGHNYVNLTTFRRSGEPVQTPVWFALADDRLYVTTPPDSGKMKRIRNDPRVVLTPCNFRGKPRGESVDGVGRPVEEGEAPARAGSAFREKYRLGLTLFRLFGRTEVGTLTLEVRPVGTEASPGQPAFPARRR